MEKTRLVKLGNLASFVRSKNAGPYRLTLDILFDRDDLYQAVASSGMMTAENIASAYGVDLSAVSSFFEVPHARAFKATLHRPRAQCTSGESDVYGAQQHVPLINMLIPVPDSTAELDDI
jgi:hypothetical protein